MELTQTNVVSFEKRLSRLSECSETSDAIVPDAYPDIGRIVCAYGTAAVRDLTPQNGRLLISGTVQTTVLYRPEGDGPLRRLSVPVSFAHIEECDGLDADTICSVQCRVASVEATPVNSRKLSVNAGLCFSCEGWRHCEVELTEAVELPRLEQMHTPLSLMLVEQVRACPITVLDDTNLQDAEEMLLVQHECSLHATECRAMHGKAVVRGTCELHGLAIGADDELRVVACSTPFTQIVELPEAEEGDELTVRLTVREADCRLEADGLLSYTVNAVALLTMRRPHTLQRIDDLYVPGHTLSLTEQQVSLTSMPQPVPFTAEVSEGLQTPHEITRVADVHAVCTGARLAPEEKLQLTAVVCLLYYDKDGRLCSTTRTVPLQVSAPCDGIPDQINLSARAAISDEHAVQVTLEVHGLTCAQTRYVLRHITAAEVEECAHTQGGVTLLARYIGAEQPLWELAKSCGTTMQAIRQANELDDQVTTVADTMLLMPLEG